MGRQNEWKRGDRGLAGERLKEQLPGFEEGRSVGAYADAEQDVEQLDEIAALEYADQLGPLTARGVELEAEIARAQKLEAKAQADADNAGPPYCSRTTCVLLMLVVLVLGAGDVVAVGRFAAFMGSPDPTTQLVLGFGLALVAIGGTELVCIFSPAFRRWMPSACLVALAVLFICVARVRVSDLLLQASGDPEAWSEAVATDIWVLATALVAYTAVTATAVAMLVDIIRDARKSNRAQRVLVAARRTREAFERELVAIHAEIENRRARIAAVVRQKKAAYLAGITAGRREAVKATNGEGTDVSGQPPSGFFSNRIFKRGRACWLLVALGLGSMGCEATSASMGRAPTLQTTIVLLDVSGSVVLTERDVQRVVDTLLARAGTCSDVIFIPVNGLAGDDYSVTSRCEHQSYANALPPGVQRARQDLPDRVREWRRLRGSDWQGAFRMAVERLNAFPGERSLVILGDLQDEAARPRGRARSTSLIPGLGTLRLEGVTVYLGFLPTAGRPTADIEAQQMSMAWVQQFSKWGVLPEKLTVRAFGIQGLEPWADRQLGPPTAGWSRWMRLQEQPATTDVPRPSKAGE